MGSGAKGLGAGGESGGGIRVQVSRVGGGGGGPLGFGVRVVRLRAVRGLGLSFGFHGAGLERARGSNASD